MRARNIKPGFFRDSDLAQCSITARLVATGLWMMADREGRIKDCPRQIKFELLPSDPVDINAILDELTSARHIVRYEAEGERFIQVRNFRQHQNPHKNEPPSKIPAYTNNTGALDTLPEHSIHYPSTPADSLIPDSLIPDSLIPDSLIPDSLIPDSELKQCSVVDTHYAKTSAPPLSAIASVTDSQKQEKDSNGKTPPCPYKEIAELHNRKLHMLANVRLITSQRMAAMGARWREDVCRQNLDWWEDYFNGVARQPFLLGHNESGWQATFDWLIKPSNMAKVLEGHYKTREPSLKGVVSEKTARTISNLNDWKPTAEGHHGKSG